MISISKRVFMGRRDKPGDDDFILISLRADLF